MDLDFINIFIKTFGLSLCIFYTCLKTINYSKYNMLKLLIFGVSIFIFSLFESIIHSFSGFYRMLITLTLYTIFLKFYCKKTFLKSLIIAELSSVICYISFFLANILISLFLMFAIKIDYTNPIISILIQIISFTFVFMLFKVKRFKYGFSFIQNMSENNYLELFTTILNTIILLTFFWLENYTNVSLQNLALSFGLVCIPLFPLIQKTLVSYHKQKLQLQTLKDYEQELAETKQKLEVAIQEKDKIVKSNHEFYHRQEALNKKLDTILKQNKFAMNTEYGEEYSDILDRLKAMSNEYETKTASIPVLDKTNVTEIDDMLTYMQSECIKNNIEFIVKIDCDVTHIINNFITKSQLETLLGDLIRNAIIAINHSSNSFKSIMIVFGIRDDSYELCILDSGIEFEINTLISLGLKPASTHTDEGGTGIGFITTFETINSCNASFIINEITNNNYTKSLEIKFDKKNEYVIVSGRSDEIKKANVDNRNITLI